MKKKVNLELLKEEIKRIKLLNEFTFPSHNSDNPAKKDNLLFGNEYLEEADDELDFGNEENMGAEQPQDGVVDKTGQEQPEAGVEPVEPPMEEPIETPEASDEVEIDVTDLVKNTDEAKAAADNSNKNTELLLQKLTSLEQKLSSMDDVSAKIEELEKEMVKRNPTPVEKLEMRSLSSYPYSQKLTDYWADKEGAYDVMDKEKEKEYILTKQDVDSDYSDTNIKQSFSVKDEDYDEENI